MKRRQPLMDGRCAGTQQRSDGSTACARCGIRRAGLHVELYGEGIDDLMKQGDGFSAGLSALLGVTLTAPEKKKGSQGIHVEMA